MTPVVSSARRLLGNSIALATVAVVGLTCYAVVQLSSLSFLQALECAEHGAGAFPLDKTTCRVHVLLLRGSPADIASLQANRGAMLLLANSAKTNDQIKADHHAARELADRTELLRFLVREGLDINAKESDSWTPLHAAIRDNDAAGMTVLLKMHPNLEIKAGPDESTPIELAKKLGREPLVAMLQKEEQEQKNILVAVENYRKKIQQMELHGSEFAPGALPPPPLEMEYLRMANHD